MNWFLTMRGIEYERNIIRVFVLQKVVHLLVYDIAGCYQQKGTEESEVEEKHPCHKTPQICICQRQLTA